MKFVLDASTALSRLLGDASPEGRRIARVALEALRQPAALAIVPVCVDVVADTPSTPCGTPTLPPLALRDD